jgi:hypothetical protein
MSQLVSDEICFYDTVTYKVPNAYDTFRRFLKLRKATIGSTALTDTIDTHTKGQDMQPNTDGTHRKGQH